MTCDHRLGYAPAASPDFNGLACEYNRWWGEPCGNWVEAPAPRPPRRFVDPTCMTKADHEGHKRDEQAGRLPKFHVERPGTLVYYTSPCEPVPVPVEIDLIQGQQAKDLSDALAALREAAEDANLKAQHEAAAAHARQMGKAHQQRMLKLQTEVRACVGMQQGDSGWRDWNDG